MKIALIGRTETLFRTAQILVEQGHELTAVITAKAAPEYTKSSEDFKLLSQEFSVPFMHTAKIIDAVAMLQSIPSVDIGISMNYTGVIPQEVIDIFPLGILNAHGGDLPRYRGNACQAWAILNDEKKVGLCIHKMVGGELDSGDIIVRDYYSLTQESTITEVHEWMSTRIPDLFMDALDLLESDPFYILEKQSVNPKDALRCYPRKPEDGAINWHKDALEIIRLINASAKPYAGAFTYLKGEKIRIWKARLGELPCPSCFIPGQILWKNDDGSVAVGTGNSGVLFIDVVQKEYSPLVSATEMVLSLRDRFGEKNV
ncbi:MAG: formyl transferase [Desulfobacterales bacterium]|nr:MAG: formyl transferase [Desulfobacterales bacterium]